MIEPDQDPLDIIQITDFTTIASISGAMDSIPTDRVIDGIDQSGLLLLGEGKGRRDYAFRYNRANLEAVRKDQIELSLKPTDPDFQFFEVFNLYHDPAERFPNEAQNGIWAGTHTGYRKTTTGILIGPSIPNRALSTNPKCRLNGSSECRNPR